jgi:hypothetical protein
MGNHVIMGKEIVCRGWCIDLFLSISADLRLARGTMKTPVRSEGYNIFHFKSFQVPVIEAYIEEASFK